jgi:hypothetical protein
MARSKGPVRASVCRLGIVMRIPRCRQYPLIFRLLYPLSPTTLPGSRLGLPLPARFTSPCSMRRSKAVASLRCPGVRTRPKSLPFPSARRWTLVEKPPWLRPSASSFLGSPFWPPLHADGLAPLCRPRSGHASRSCLLCPPVAGRLQGADPTPLPSSNGRSGQIPWTKGRISRAGPSRVPRYARPKGCRSGCADGLGRDDQYAVSVVAGAQIASPTVGRLSLLCAYPLVCQSPSQV